MKNWIDFEIGLILSVWKFLYWQKSFIKTLFSKILGQSIHFIEYREVVVPPRMHRLSNMGKTTHWDTFESRSRIFIPANYEQFWGNSEICPIFQSHTTFSLFGISPNGFETLIVMLSALCTYNLITIYQKMTELWHKRTVPFIWEHPV